MIAVAAAKTFPWDAADNMLACGIKRADELASRADNPSAEAKLDRVVKLIEAYEVERWPIGKVSGRRVNDKEDDTER